jgi:hypothetical protein
MTEGSTEAPVTEIPDYKTNWEKIRNQIPFFPPENWEGSLDSICYAWKNNKKIDARMLRLSSALALTSIPEPEIREATMGLRDLQKERADLNSGTSAIAAGTKLKWEKVEQLAQIAEEFTGDGGFGLLDMNTAVLEAINQVANEPQGLPKDFRQRIAQHAFGEIFQVGKYRELEYKGIDSYGEGPEQRTTQDSVELEKAELVSALRNKPWGVRKTNEMRKVYKEWRRAILVGDTGVDEEDMVADDLKSLWLAASKGAGTSKYSTQVFLSNAEGIYTAMESGGAFDIEPEEYEEEGDELEDEDERDFEEEDEA